jgi:hypothetical protein
MFSMIGLLSFMTACAGVPEPYPAPANPFLSGATTLEKASLSKPTKVGLVWLAPAGSKFPSEAAQRALAEKIKTKLSTGTRLEIVGAATVAAPAGDVLSEVRKAAASFNVPQVLVVMPEGTEVVSPVWLQYGRNGSAIGTRTDSYATVALVALDLASGKSLYSVVTNGEARLLATDYDDARPWYPRISPGRTSAFIYPDGASFPPGEVRAVALEQAVNGLIYELEKVSGI